MRTEAITRRRALGYGGAAGVALAGGGMLPGLLKGASAAQAATSCATLTPDLEEGPYFVDLDLHRSDVVANTANASVDPGVAQSGVPLTLTVNVTDASNNCAAYNDVHVDIWHANPIGLYSDESSQNSGDSTTDQNTVGQNFLRGYQITGVDAIGSGAAVDGQVQFQTIWPGWYSGLAIHIHMRLRAYSSAGSTVTDYTTRIFFSDADNDNVLENASPYNTRSTIEDPTTDENDRTLGSAYSTNVVSVTGSIAAGFAATFNIVLDEGIQDTSAVGSGTTTSTTTTTGTTGTTTSGTTGTTTTGTTGTSTGSTLAATLAAVKTQRSKSGGRFTTAKLTVPDKVTVGAGIMRNGKQLASTKGHVAAGTHAMKITIPKHVAAGAATLYVALADASGATKVLGHAIHVPARTS